MKEEQIELLRRSNLDVFIGTETSQETMNYDDFHFQNSSPVPIIGIFPYLFLKYDAIIDAVINFLLF